MIITYEASEFISMIIMNEKSNDKNNIEISFNEINDLAREIERKTNGHIHINLSSDSIQSYFARVPKSIYLKNDILYVNNITNVYSFLKYYANEDTLKNILKNYE